MNKPTVPLNLYGIMDQELARMHTLMHAYLALPTHPQQQSSYSSTGNPQSHSNMGVLFGRIQQMQDVLLQALISHDKLLQDRIAELALTGESKSEST